MNQEEEQCLDCGTYHKPGDQCEICTALLRVQKLARDNRERYRIKKIEQWEESKKARLPHADD